MRRTAAPIAALALALALLTIPGLAVAEPTVERTVDDAEPAPGDTVTVTLTADLEEAATVDVVETVSPAVASTEVQTVEQDGQSLVPTVTNAEPNGVTVLLDADQTADGALRIEYTLTVPEDATPDTSFQFEPVLQVNDTQVSVTDDSVTELTVAGEADDGGLPSTGGDGDESDDSTGEEATGEPDEAGDAADQTADETDRTADEAGDGTDQPDDGTDETAANGEDSLPGFGAVTALAALSLVGLLGLRRRP